MTYVRVPREPLRLIGFLCQPRALPNVTGQPSAKMRGGVKDPGGDVRALIGGPKGRPGLINNTDGHTLDDSAQAAWEAGYFPEYGEERPDINALLDAIGDDHRGVPRYSIYDWHAVQEFEHARDWNNETAREETRASDNEADAVSRAITVTIKSVYGREHIYPACEMSRMFCALAGLKTITDDMRRVLVDHGYSFNVEAPALARQLVAAGR